MLAEENVEFLVTESRPGHRTYDTLHDVEVASWQRASIILAVSEQDAQVIRAGSGRAVLVAPNSGSHVVLPDRAKDLRRSMTGGYLGSYMWPPSRITGELLIQSIWPRIREQKRAATLDIIGVGWPQHLGPPGSGIAIQGRAASVSDALAHLTVFLCPAERASGSKLKMHEALRIGCPIVTFAGGIGGFPSRVRDAVALAKNVDHFVELTARVLDDVLFQDQLAKSALEVASGLPTWDSSAACVNQAWESVARR